MLLYTVLKGTEEIAMLADTSLTNTHLVQHCFRGEGDFSCSTWIRKSSLSEIMHLLVGVPRTSCRDCSLVTIIIHCLSIDDCK